MGLYDYVKELKLAKYNWIKELKQLMVFFNQKVCTDI